jgi:hypothetical protein
MRNHEAQEFQLGVNESARAAILLTVFTQQHWLSLQGARSESSVLFFVCIVERKNDSCKLSLSSERFVTLVGRMPVEL